MGTYIARLIARVHGGDIEFESSSAEGTALIVKLPQP
jgi:signal transduction histidine kinase